MLPTMTDFERALDAPTLYFCRLRNIRCSYANGRPVVRRTYYAAEAEVEWNARRYLLYMPFRRDMVIHIEELELGLGSVEVPFLCRHHIFYNEMLVMPGRGERVDVILQELPDGVWLDDSHMSAAELSHQLCVLENQMQSIGFSHNNLSSANIRLDSNGVVRLLRYWYASLLPGIRDDMFATTTAFAESEACVRVLEDTASSYGADTLSHREYLHDGMLRFVSNGKMGFYDEDGRVAIEPIYCYAGDFEEGRAVVSNAALKMGAIDKSGRTIVPLIYDDITFDVDKGLFFAYQGEERYVINYCGEVISHDIESESKAPTLQDPQPHIEVLGTDDESRH